MGTCYHSLGNKTGCCYCLQMDFLNIYCEDGSGVLAAFPQRVVDRAVSNSVSGLFSSLKVTSAPRGAGQGAESGASPSQGSS